MSNSALRMAAPTLRAPAGPLVARQAGLELGDHSPVLDLHWVAHHLEDASRAAQHLSKANSSSRHVVALGFAQEPSPAGTPPAAFAPLISPRRPKPAQPPTEPSAALTACDALAFRPASLRCWENEGSPRTAYLDRPRSRRRGELLGHAVDAPPQVYGKAVAALGSCRGALPIHGPSCRTYSTAVLFVWNLRFGGPFDRTPSSATASRRLRQFGVSNSRQNCLSSSSTTSSTCSDDRRATAAASASNWNAAVSLRRT